MRATQAGTIGELRGRHNLNALSRRSSSYVIARKTRGPLVGDREKSGAERAAKRGNIKQGDTLKVYAAGELLAFKVTQPEQSEPANGSPLRSRG